MSTYGIELWDPAKKSHQDMVPFNVPPILSWMLAELPSGKLNHLDLMGSGLEVVETDSLGGAQFTSLSLITNNIVSIGNRSLAPWPRINFYEVGSLKCYSGGDVNFSRGYRLRGAVILEFIPSIGVEVALSRERFMSGRHSVHVTNAQCGALSSGVKAGSAGLVRDAELARGAGTRWMLCGPYNACPDRSKLAADPCPRANLPSRGFGHAAAVTHLPTCPVPFILPFIQA
ncbi:hypothetical protein AAG570_010574 [Ranatra chinensis]|uniref:Uncharacterized protein n=1 Tax=Ranatra chinensis TaxID=642074 RepID=A0ABD0Z116_9HEMI